MYIILLWWIILKGENYIVKPLGHMYIWDYPGCHAFCRIKMLNDVNAYLLSDDNEISLKAVAFEGTDKSVMSKRAEYGGRCLLVRSVDQCVFA